MTRSSVNSLSDCLIQNTHIQDLYLSNHLGDHGSECMARVLRTNMTLRKLYLGYNSIEHVRNLSLSVSSNMTLRELYLSDNCIQNAGALELAKCILKNTTLSVLDLNGNSIGNDGAIAFATSLRFNDTLSCLYLEKNTIEYIGTRKLLESLRRNRGLRKLKVRSIEDEMGIQEEINFLVDWNIREKNRTTEYNTIFPWSYRDHVVLLFLVLGEVDIYPDLVWKIVNMLKVEDVVVEVRDKRVDSKIKYVDIGKRQSWWRNLLNSCSGCREGVEPKK